LAEAISFERSWGKLLYPSFRGGDFDLLLIGFFVYIGFEALSAGAMLAGNRASHVKINSGNTCAPYVDTLPSRRARHIDAHVVVAQQVRRLPQTQVEFGGVRRPEPVVLKRAVAERQRVFAGVS